MSWDRLRQLIETYLNLEELRTLCFDLNVDYESLGGEGKSAKVRELVAQFRRSGKVPELITYLTKLRPNMRWDELRLDDVPVPSPPQVTRAISPQEEAQPPHLTPPSQPQPDTSPRSTWRNWGDHPVVVIVGLVIGAIAIYTFVTGNQSLLDPNIVPTSTVEKVTVSELPTIVPTPRITPTVISTAEATLVPTMETDRPTNTTTVETVQAATPTAVGGGTGRIAYVSDRGGNNSIYVIDVSSGQVQKLTDDPREARRPAWSPDGSKLIFNVRSDVGYDIYMSNADGSELANITHSPQPDYSRAAWSPDGTRIAFGTTHDKDNNDIYVLRVGEAQPVDITNDPGQDYDPAWSPDGKQIAFTSVRGGPPAIYVMAEDGSGQAPLASGGSPVWSPDGTRIAFAASNDGNYDIYVMNANGSNVVRLTNNAARDASPSWSPDGTKIAFVSTRDEPGGGVACNDDSVLCKNTIYFLDVNSGDVTRVTSSNENSRAPVWQPDTVQPGNRIVYNTFDNEDDTKINWPI